MSIEPRMKRLFAADGKCFDVAIDHGFFNEYRFLSGIENIKTAVETVVEAAPDAIQLTPGQSRFLQNIPGPNKPALVMRTDVANVYGHDLPDVLFTHLIEDAVITGLRLDAACVVVNLMRIPGAPEIHMACVENISALKPICEEYGMPLMVEPLVFQPNEEAGGYMVDGDITKIMPLVRQAVEMGADIIKADPSENIEAYHRVIEVASDTPVLVRGGGRVADEVILKRTYDLMQQGAKGIVYGRNVIQHKNPRGMTQALMAVVHDGADVVAAMAYLKE